MRSSKVLLASLTMVSAMTAFPAQGLPPAERRHFRSGANHILGDDGVIFEEGTNIPLEKISEERRTHDHLLYVHALLAARPATRPELESRRAELLGYLADYIAKGVTPRNEHVPWSSPVFIDDEKEICAVGYLIERTEGRAFAETISRSHRYDFLEDIAAAMPSVADWVASSGFSLAELASIQPNYVPATYHFQLESITATGVDGPCEQGGMKGELRSGHLEGHWTRTSEEGVLLGEGDFHRGAGHWVSSYASGTKLAEGEFENDVPHGQWRLYHPSGNLAAKGAFRRGIREGAWTFFDDSSQRIKLAAGSFKAGDPSGTWAHFSASGSVLAVSSERSLHPCTPTDCREGYRTDYGPAHMLEIVPGRDGVRHQIKLGGSFDGYRVDMLKSPDGFRLYFGWTFEAPRVFDETGHELLEDDDGHWTTRDCSWSAAVKLAARIGDLEHVELGDPDDCSPATPMSDDRASRAEALLQSNVAIRAATPAFIDAMVMDGRSSGDADPIDCRKWQNAGVIECAHSDLAKVLAWSMVREAMWPHVDNGFFAMSRTLPVFSPSDQGWQSPDQK
jgi:hypothetical protein